MTTFDSKSPVTPQAPNACAATEHRREIVAEIEQLRRELAVRRSVTRRASRSVVLAYHELLERQYSRLDALQSD
ncbi:MAG TPA: hypothetical protein VFG38_14240 [Pseudomonadales bacterium]|nr:hypothetical protein [Pseudomonadales bacterium]